MGAGICVEGLLAVEPRSVSCGELTTDIAFVLLWMTGMLVGADDPQEAKTRHVTVVQLTVDVPGTPG